MNHKQEVWIKPDSIEHVKLYYEAIVSLNLDKLQEQLEWTIGKYRAIVDLNLVEIKDTTENYRRLISFDSLDSMLET